jgi:hypothetical protein
MARWPKLKDFGCVDLSHSKSTRTTESQNICRSSRSQIRGVKNDGYHLTVVFVLFFLGRAGFEVGSMGFSLMVTGGSGRVSARGWSWAQRVQRRMRSLERWRENREECVLRRGDWLKLSPLASCEIVRPFLFCSAFL